MTKNLLEIFLIKLCRNKDVLTKKMRRSYVINGVDVPYSIKEILDILNENIYTIGDVAYKVGKSQGTVKQLFSCYRKEGMIKYYNSRKIREAKRLIREGNYNMAQITDLLCFDNSQYFSKCFRASTNMSPSEYKSSIIK